MSRFEEIQIKGVVDENNSTTSELGIGGVFTGTKTNILNFGIVFVTIFTDVASAIDGLSIQQSSDGINWDHDTNDNYTIAAGANKNFSINPHSKWFRVVYTNGGVEQGAGNFRLQSICKGNSKASSHRIKDNIIGDDDVELVKAALTGVNGAGLWHNVGVTEDGDLTISDNSSGLSIAEGNVSGKSFIHKFGFATDFDSGDGIVTVWDGANDGLFAGSPPMSYTYSSSADIDTISSSDNGDTQTIEIIGLDSNFDEVMQDIILTGQTDAILETALIRIYRMVNRGNSDLSGVVYLRTNGSGQSGGVPTNANTSRSIINNGNNQTLMAIYTIPSGKTGYMRSWYASLAGAKKTSVHIIHLDARPFGEVFQLKHVSSLVAIGTTNIQHVYVEPEIFLEKTDIEMQANSDEDQASISAGFDIVLVDN